MWKLVLGVVVGLLAAASAIASPLTRLPRVVDANRRVIGGLSSPYALRKEQGAVVWLPVEFDTERLGYGCAVQFAHEHVDCSGNRLVASTGTFQIAYGGPPCSGPNRAARAYYGITFTTRDIYAHEYRDTPAQCAATGGTPTPDGYCCLPVLTSSGGAKQSNPENTATAQSFDIQQYHAPFSIE